MQQKHFRLFISRRLCFHIACAIGQFHACVNNASFCPWVFDVERGCNSANVRRNNVVPVGTWRMQSVRKRGRNQGVNAGSTRTFHNTFHNRKMLVTSNTLDNVTATTARWHVMVMVGSKITQQQQARAASKWREIDAEQCTRVALDDNAYLRESCQFLLSHSPGRWRCGR